MTYVRIDQFGDGELKIPMSKVGGADHEVGLANQKLVRQLPHQLNKKRHSCMKYESVRKVKLGHHATQRTMEQQLLPLRFCHCRKS